MPVSETIRLLAQMDIPMVLTDVYTVPAGKSATISSVVFCNRSNVDTNFRLALAVAGGADAPQHYVYYDVPLPGNDTFIATVGITLGPGDVVRAKAGANTVSVNCWGCELAVS